MFLLLEVKMPCGGSRPTPSQGGIPGNSPIPKGDHLRVPYGLENSSLQKIGQVRTICKPVLANWG